MQLHAFVYFVFAALLTVSTVLCESSSGFEAEAELLEREELAADEPRLKPKCRRLGQSSGLRGLGQCHSAGEAQEGVESVPMVNMNDLQPLPRGGGEAVAPIAEAGAPTAEAKEAKLQELREKVRLCIHMDMCVYSLLIYTAKRTTSVY